MVQRTWSLGEVWVRDAWWCPCGFNIWLSSFVGVSEAGRSSPGSKLGSSCSSSVVGEAWKGRSGWEAASPASWRSQRRSCCSYRCSGKLRRGCVVFKYWCVWPPDSVSEVYTDALHVSLKSREALSLPSIGKVIRQDWCLKNFSVAALQNKCVSVYIRIYI